MDHGEFRSMRPRNIDPIKESFIPLLLILLALFLLLFYSWFKANYDEQKVLVIEISDDQFASTVEGPEELEEKIFSELHIEEADDPTSSKALKLLTEGKWIAAEVRYKSILTDTKTSRSLNDVGIFYLKKGDKKKALSYFDQAINTVPVYDLAYFNRGVVLSEMERYVDAVHDYEKMTEYRPNHFEAYYNAGVSLLKLAEYDRALQFLTKASSLSSGENKAKALYNMGLTYRRLSPPQLDDAAGCFEESIRLKPDYVEPRFALGALKPETPEGRKQAFELYETVLALKPNYPKAYYNIGLIYTAQKKWSKAEEAYSKAIQFGPEYLKARYNLGLLYIQLKHWDDAILQFDWIVQRFPDHAESYFNIGRALFGAKKYPESLKYYQQAIDAAGNNYPEAFLNKGLVYKTLKNYPEAIQSYKLALKLRKIYPEAWFNLGSIYMDQKKWKDAENSLKKAIDLKPGYYQAWFNLGIVHSRTNNNDQSIAAYRKALELKPDYLSAKINLAIRYAEENDYLQAIRLYEEVLDQDKSYFNAWLNIGVAYIHTGQDDKAEKALVKALELAENSKARRYLGRIYTRRKRFEEAIESLNRAIDADSNEWRNRYELAKTLIKAGDKKSALDELEKGLRLAPNNRLLKKKIKLLKKELP